MQNLKDFFSDIPKNVKTLGWVSFFTDMSSDLIFPILPIYLRNVLGINEALIGLIDGTANGLAEIFKVFSGRLSDYLKSRKGLIFVGYLLSSLSKPIIALTNTWPLLMAAKVADRVGKGIRVAPKNALVAESSDPKKLGTSFGFDSMLDTSGAIGGTLILYLLLNFWKVDYKSIFLLSIIPASISVLIIIFGVKDIASPKVLKTETNSTFFSKKAFTKLGWKYYLFLTISAIFSLGTMSYSFLLLKSNDFGITALQIPLLYLFFSIIQAVLAAPLGRISDKTSKSSILLAGYIAFCLLAFTAMHVSNIFILLLVFVFYGLFMACQEGAGRALVSILSPEDTKATSIGLYQTVVGIMTFFGNILFGYIWTNYGSDVSFGFSLFCATIGTIMLVGYKLRKLV